MDEFYIYCMDRKMKASNALLLGDIITSNGDFEVESYEDFSELKEYLDEYYHIVLGGLGARKIIRNPYIFKYEYNVELTLINRDKYVESIRKFTDKYGIKKVVKQNFYFDSDNYKYK